MNPPETEVNQEVNQTHSRLRQAMNRVLDSTTPTDQTVTLPQERSREDLDRLTDFIDRLTQSDRPKQPVWLSNITNQQ